MAENKFITYTHPNELTSRSNRRIVARHVAVHHRNRSAPSSRTSTSLYAQLYQRRLAPAKHESVAPRRDSPPYKIRAQFSASTVPRDGLGLRRDPFSAFPTSHISGLAPVIDYYIQIYAPAHLIRPEMIAPMDSKIFIGNHFRDALQKPVMFESILALMFSTFAAMNWTAQELGKRAMVHYGEAVSLLRQSLAVGRIEDAILFSIASIMGVNYLWDDLSAFQANLVGLRQIVALRGGLNALGSPLLLKPVILTLESFWTYLRAQEHLLLQNLAPIVPIDHPVRTGNDFDMMASKLPAGFRVLAKQRRLSINVVEIILREVEFSASLSHSPPTAYPHHDGIRKFAHLRTKVGDEVTIGTNIQTCEDLARLLSSTSLTHLDTVCCIGLFINALCVTRSEQLSPIYLRQMQHHAKQLLNHRMSEYDSAARDLVMWSIFNVASTMVPSGLVKPLNTLKDDPRLALAAEVARTYLEWTWEEVESLLRQFICSDTCAVVFKNVWEIGRLQISC